MGKPLTNFTLSLFLGFLFIQTVFAGDTGKITGTVIEKETGDPLPGANVILLENSYLRRKLNFNIIIKFFKILS